LLIDSPEPKDTVFPDGSKFAPVTVSFTLFSTRDFTMGLNSSRLSKFVGSNKFKGFAKETA